MTADANSGGNEQTEWSIVGSDGRKAKECYNCYEVGHLRQNCVNRKRVKCFNCEKLGHIQKDCIEPSVVRQRDEAWRDNEVVKRLVASRATQSSAGMTVLQAFLEVDEGQMWKVKRDLGITILEFLGLEPSLIVGYNKDVKGIQARGANVEFWLSQNADIDR